MPEKSPLETTVPLNAPRFMRPQRSVLDEPLDLDRAKRSRAAEPFETIETETAAADFGIPAVLVDEPLVPVEPVSDPSVTAEAPGEGLTDLNEMELPFQTPGQAEEAPAPAEPVETAPAAVPAPQLMEEPAPQRSRGMTPLQTFIVILLVVLVGLLLSIGYLYINGRIELPPEVLQTVENWLDFIP